MGAISSIPHTVLSFVNGPAGSEPGRFPGERVALGLRGAFAAWLAGSLLFTAVGPPALPWVTNLFSTSTAVTATTAVQRHLGSSLVMCVAMLTGGTFFITIGTLVAALTFAMGGMQFRNWLICVMTFPTLFMTVIMCKIAANVPPPRPIMFSDATFAWAAALPLITFVNQGGTQGEGPSTLLPLLHTYTGYVAWFCGSAGIGFLASSLPFGLGAISGWRSVPNTLAGLLQSLGGYQAAVSFMRQDFLEKHQVVDRRALLRHQALTHSANLRQFMRVAMAERCGGYVGHSAHALEVSRTAEVCRIALIMQHKADLKSRSPATQAIYYKGVFNASLQEVHRATSKTLHGASSLLSQVAGLDPPTTELGDDAADDEVFVDEDECRRLASNCHAIAQRFAAQWNDMSSSSESMRKQATSLGMQDHAHGKDITSQTPLLEVCQAETSVVGTLAAAQAAIKAAIAAADFAEERATTSRLTGICVPACGGIGIMHWPMILAAGPTVWCAGFQQGWRFALRLSIAMTFVTILLATVPLPHSEPSRGLWAVMSVGLLLTPVLGAAFLKSVRRVIGSICGALLAVGLVLISQWDYAGLWVWLGAIAFFVKYFEKELQYAGLATLITYSSLIGIALQHPDDFRTMIAAGFWRVAETITGVLIVGFVSVFIAPERATPKVRAKELDALASSASIFAAACKALSAAIPSQMGQAPGDGTSNILAGVEPNEEDEEGRDIDGGCRDASAEDDEPSIADLRVSAWGMMQEFFFGGDGKPGIGDTLGDCRSESNMGADGGFDLLCGVLWLPDAYCRCCCDSGLASGFHCLDAVKHISTLTRGTQVLVAMVEAGFQGGGDVLLSDPRVDQALGPHGEGFSSAVRGVVASLSPLLRSPGVSEESETKKLLEMATASNEFHFYHDGVTAQDTAIAEARARLNEAESRLQLLLEGAEAGRSQARGAIMKASQASSAGSAHRVASTLFLLKDTLHQMKLIIDSLAGDASGTQSSLPY